MDDVKERGSMTPRLLSETRGSKYVMDARGRNGSWRIKKLWTLSQGAKDHLDLVLKLSLSTIVFQILFIDLTS